MNRADGLSAKTVFFYFGLLIVIVVCIIGLSRKEASIVKGTLLLGDVVREPSGLTYHPERRTLVVVGDEGQVVELTLEGEVLTNKNIGGDLEAITADPHRKLLYAVEEKEEKLFLLDWDTLDRVGEIDLKPFVEEAGLGRDRNDGFEAVAFQPAGGVGRPTDRLILGHQHRPVAILYLVLEGNPPVLTFQKRLDLDIKEVAGLCYDAANDRIRVLCDPKDRFYEITEEGAIIAQRRLPGKAQEGIAFSPDGDLFIADDKGGIYRYSAGQLPGDIGR